MTARIRIVSGVALVMFSIVFIRLWYLQVLSGDRYLIEARNNQVRDLRAPAPRGQVVDRNGKVLVDNRTTLALIVQPAKLPSDPALRRAELSALSPVARMRVPRMEAEIRAGAKLLPQGPVTLRRDIRYDGVYYLQENQRRFPGVSVERVFLRQYRMGTLAAQLFGNVGEVTAKQLKRSRYRRLTLGDEVGQSGLEYTYDRFLRGEDGATKIQVDALGRPKGQLSIRQAVPGDTLKLALDAGVQKAGEQALAARGLPGAFVAMDVHTGAILGMGSYPTFDPAVFTRRLTQSTYRNLTSQRTGAPLFNRAIAGAYPTGSTFKPITAMAALTAGIISTTALIVDTGSIKIGNLTFKNSGGGIPYGALDLSTALKVSSDVFFYILGQRAETKGEAIQRWAHLLGIGQPTGIDVPGESGGLIPTPEWRNRLFHQHLTDRPWSVGDNINLAVGQGDLQADPLQMAVAYATIANGGQLLRPHVGSQIEDAAGRVLQEVRPSIRRKLKIDPAFRQAILDGLHRAAQEPGGTSYKVFSGFPIPISGKTGTAQRPGQADQSWYVAIAPYGDPQIVVATTIERGGFGVDAAAPATARILAQYFNVRKMRGKGGTAFPSAPAGPSTPGVVPSPQIAGRAE